MEPGSSQRMRRLAETAAQIARRRREVLDALRVAVVAEDTPEVYRLGRLLTGLEESDAEGNRAGSDLH